MQVKQAMHDIKAKLVLERGAEAPCLAPSRLSADKNLAVLKRDYIRRAWLLKKTAMQFRHAAVRNQNDAHLSKASQRTRFRSVQFQAFLQNVFREIPQRRRLYRHLSLAIEHRYCRHLVRLEKRLTADYADDTDSSTERPIVFFSPHPCHPRHPRLNHVTGRDSAWKFRVIRRAPLLNVTYAQAHCISTAMRLRKPTRKMMCTKSQTSQAGLPLK